MPDDLQRYVALDPSRPRYDDWTRWSQRVATAPSEFLEDCLGEACAWISRRTLDTMYLRPQFNLRLWSDQNLVHLQWDNRDEVFRGFEPWTARLGSWSLSREAFKCEIRRFHQRLVDQMAQRIACVEEGALPSGIRIDLPALRSTQAACAESIERNLGAPAPATDWDVIRQSIEALQGRGAE